MDIYKNSRLRFLDSQMMTDQCRYTDISLPTSNVDQVVVRTNGSLFAVPLAGPNGQLFVRPVLGVERFTHNATKLNCHKYAISSFTFDPFNSSSLLTGADNGEIKLWNIPKEGVVSPGLEPVFTLEGHRRKVVTMEYNPVASNIVATGSSDGSIRVWDVASTKEITTANVKEMQLQEMKWDYTGSLLCSGLKNREYSIWDIRTSSPAVTWEGHQSPRRSYMTWLGDSYYIVTTGYSRRSNREVILRDIRNIETPIYTITADNSPGPFIPYYNPCCHILWYAGRGDAKLNGIDVDDVSMWTNREGGNCITINLRSSVKSLAMFPHHTLDFQANEVDKFLRINDDCGIDKMVISMPHQAGASIYEIYGDCPGPNPTISSTEWIQGSVSKPQCLSPAAMGMHGYRGGTKQPMNLLKTADMKEWIQDQRKQHLTPDQLNSMQHQLQSIARSVQSHQASSSPTTTTPPVTRQSLSGRSLNLNSSAPSPASATRGGSPKYMGRPISPESPTAGKGPSGTSFSRPSSASSVTSNTIRVNRYSTVQRETARVTTNGVTRRVHVNSRGNDSYQAVARGGGGKAQLEQSKTRLCINVGLMKNANPITNRVISPSSSSAAAASPPPSQSSPNTNNAGSPSFAGRSLSVVSAKPVLPSVTRRPFPEINSPMPAPAPVSVPPPVRRSSPVENTKGVTLGEIRRSHQAQGAEVSRSSIGQPSSVVMSRLSHETPDMDEIGRRLTAIEQRMSQLDGISDQLNTLSQAVDRLSKQVAGQPLSELADIKVMVDSIRRYLRC